MLVSLDRFFEVSRERCRSLLCGGPPRRVAHPSRGMIRTDSISLIHICDVRSIDSLRMCKLPGTFEQSASWFPTTEQLRVPASLFASCCQRTDNTAFVRFLLDAHETQQSRQMASEKMCRRQMHSSLSSLVEFKSRLGLHQSIAEANS
uniref:Uncharacterized protein n=1 Tax=Rhodosorus marinus TaxID=101924 RepID=A0A7S2ZBC7_9RHOD